eukprot:8256964-Alexandrium_andersonii.AAC.1
MAPPQKGLTISSKLLFRQGAFLGRRSATDSFGRRLLSSRSSPFGSPRSSRYRRSSWSSRHVPCAVSKTVAVRYT